MKRFTQAFALLAISLALTIVFQNCAGYETNSNPLYDIRATKVCLGASCGSSVDDVQLEIPSPIAYVDYSASPSGFCTSSTCVDVGGYCETAGFPDSVIYAQWFGPSGSAVSSRFATVYKCDELGRFRALLTLPPNYNYRGDYTVRLTLAVKDQDGKEPAISNGLNFKPLKVMTNAESLP